MIERISNALRLSLDKQELTELLSERKSLGLKNFLGSSISFFLHHLRTGAPHILVITAEPERAAAWASDLQELEKESAEFLLFPPSNRKPYDDQMVPDLSMMVQRSEVLERLKTLPRAVIFTSADAISEKLISQSEFQKHSITLKTGQTMEPARLMEQLVDQNYEAVEFVSTPGEYALRGGIMDVYPFSGELPVRLEFFGDEIESIREFDPDSQRSVAFLNEARFVPSAAFEKNGSKENLFSYLPDNAIILVEQPDLVLQKIRENQELAAKAYVEAKRKDLPPPEEEFLTADEYEEQIGLRPLIVTGSFSESVVPNRTLELEASPHPEFNGSFKLLREWIKENSVSGIQTVILCNGESQKERFEELLGEPDESFLYRLTVFSLHEGFVLRNQGLALLTDHQIFNRYHRPRLHGRRRVSGGISFKELRDLNIGDFVVHVDHGIGRFAGFKTIQVRDSTQEAAVLRYQDDSILYVNVTNLHKLQKYSGKEGMVPRISKLGSGEWARKKSRTKKKVKDIARDLIRLYAKRKAAEAYAFSPDTAWQIEMEARFEYEETPDQLSAIEAVKRDMESSQPMDRLVCGDVGFGKTEVAIRAAFKAAMDQKQVAILVPTTILADQHYKTFRKRMADFPVRVEVLSRFVPPAEQKKIIVDLKEGKVDIVIGTHRLVSKDVAFHDLGLLIIDEEQRFGVAVKERLKKFRASVDVLAMTATPIPRTLQFSLMGARDLSVINTPPPNRQPVYTEIHSFSEELIYDAVVQEISRGGQIFFIHNRVKNIEELADMIRAIVPNVRIRVAHGQMAPAQLEKIIHDFYEHKFDMLISTNIVESGIDISNANTMFINNADNFGLAELHQLRGRVGRSNRKAYCYLLTPPVETLTAEARKRLTALEEYSDLGSGFNIAMRDLDIRGAGDILGAEQSGFVNEIGFALYSKILDDAVRELKQDEFGDLFDLEPLKPDHTETQVDFDYSALLEREYVSDNVERLNLYRKLAEAQTEKELDDWQEELTDRFGPMPAAAQNLLLTARIRLAASRLYYRKVTIRAGKMWLLCPSNESDLGKEFFEEGLFQKQLEVVGRYSGDGFKLAQKKEALRLVIPDISGPEAALDYLSRLHKETFPQEVTA